MNQGDRRRAPDGYRLRVDGHLGRCWSAWFDNLTVTMESDGTTSLSGAISDQAELHGVLSKIRDLGVILISVEAIGPEPDVAGEQLPHPRPTDLGELEW